MSCSGCGCSGHCCESWIKAACDPGSLSPPSMTVLLPGDLTIQVMDPLRWLGLWGRMWGKQRRQEVKGPLHKGCGLNSLSASICCDFLCSSGFLSVRRAAIQIPFSQKRLGVERRKWLSPSLFQCPLLLVEVVLLWSVSSEFLCMGELPSLLPSSIFPLQTVFSEWFYSNHLFSAICVLHCSILLLCFFPVILHLWVTLALKTSIGSLWYESLGGSLFCFQESLLCPQMETVSDFLIVAPSRVGTVRGLASTPGDLRTWLALCHQSCILHVLAFSMHFSPGGTPFGWCFSPS